MMADGGRTLFAGPFDDGGPRELALTRLPASYQLRRQTVRYPDGRHPFLPVWELVDTALDQHSLIAWSGARRQFTSCPSPFFSGATIGVVDPTGDWAAILRAPSGYGGSDPGPLQLIGPGTCARLADWDVTAAAFSPDGTALAWVVQPLSGDGALWLAGVDGSGAREVGSGRIANPYFTGPSSLELQLGEDLVWFDVHDDPVRLHYVLEGLDGMPVDLGDHLIAIYDYSSQDGNGRLGLVNRWTGEKRLISSDVTGRAVTGPPGVSWPAAYEEEGLRVVYRVRGRNPSPQDGIWIATITADDLR